MCRALPAVALVGAMSVIPASPVWAQEPGAPRPLGRDVQVYVPAVGDVRPREAPEQRNPTGRVSLGDVVALALLQHPGLAAYAWETRAREARVLQADRPPNPALSAAFEDVGARSFAGGGLNEPIQPQATIQLSQVVELGGKRVARARQASAHRDLATWDYEAARMNVLTGATQAFIDVLAAQESVTEIERTTRLVEEVQATVAQRVAAGDVSPIEETRATVAAASVRVELARARRALDASRARLAASWGSATPAFAGVDGTLERVLAPLPPIGALGGRLEQNPDLARWAAEIAERQAAVSVERSRAVPDVTLAAGYRRFTGVDANAIVVGASISLPIFDKNRGAIQEAERRVAKAHEERRAAESAAAANLATAYAALASAHDEVTTLGSIVMPGSQQAFEAVTEGYRLGRFGYLDVLEAQRTLIDAGAQHRRALAEYHKAVADLERLIGLPLRDVAGATASRE